MYYFQTITGIHLAIDGTDVFEDIQVNHSNSLGISLIGGDTDAVET